MDADLASLEQFIVRAKARTYVGGGQKVAPSRPGSVDLTYAEAPYGYLDSYVGGLDFLGEELVTFEGRPVWAMNYYGWNLHPEVLDGEATGALIREALTEMYAEGRFLGGFRYHGSTGDYEDESTGDVSHFTGREWIAVGGEIVYELAYHGGLVRP